MSKRYPGVRLASGATWPTGSEGRRLLHKLSQVAQDIGHPILIVSGKRTQYQQWALYMRYLQGTGNLAAPCCWKRYQHSWSSCGRQCASHHCRSMAVDCGVLDRHGNYTSIGYSDRARASMKKHGLVLNVGGEKWHVVRQATDPTWRA